MSRKNKREFEFIWVLFFAGFLLIGSRAESQDLFARLSSCMRLLILSPKRLPTVFVGDLIRQRPNKYSQYLETPMMVEFRSLFGKEPPRSYGPMTLVNIGRFDDFRQQLIRKIVMESRSEERIQRAIAAEIARERKSRAEALRSYRQNRSNDQYRRALQDAVPYWRDRSNIEPQVRRNYENGIETAAFIIFFTNGRVVVTGIFSGDHGGAHCRIEEIEAYLLGYAHDELKKTGVGIESAELFHFHPESAVLSEADFKAADGLLDTYPFIGKIKIHAIESTDSQIFVSSYTNYHRSQTRAR